MHVFPFGKPEHHGHKHEHNKHHHHHHHQGHSSGHHPGPSELPPFIVQYPGFREFFMGQGGEAMKQMCKKHNKGPHHWAQHHHHIPHGHDGHHHHHHHHHHHKRMHCGHGPNENKGCEFNQRNHE